MTKPVLPPCSVRDCKRVADAVIKGMLLCGEHAVIEIEKVKLARANNGQVSNGRPATPERSGSGKR